MKLLIDTQWYWYIFKFLPDLQIMERYVVSIGSRLLLIVACVGIWQLKDWARKLALGLFVVNLLILPWKHPVVVIQNSFDYYHTDKMIQWLLNNAGVDMPELNWAQIAAAFLNVWDLLFYAILIFYFSRKRVKDCFNKS